jgi:pilus assembly protein Flp/PilA
MKALIAAAQQFGKDEEGITAIEYGLIAAVIAAVIIGSFKALGDVVDSAFDTIGTKLTAALPK